MSYGKVTNGGGTERSSPYGAGEADLEPCDTVYVSGLPEDVTEELLSDVFGAHGTIAWRKVLLPKAGKRSALIQMSSIEEATKLIEECDGTVPAGLEEEVQVKYSTTKQATRQSTPAPTTVPALVQRPVAAGLKASEAVASDTLYCSGLPHTMDSEAISSVFSQLGDVAQVTAGTPGSAIVQYGSVEEAATVRGLSGSVLSGLEAAVTIRFCSRVGGNSNDDPAPSDKIRVTDIQGVTDEEGLLEVFGHYGTVLEVKVLSATEDNVVATIRLNSVEEASTLRGMSGSILAGLNAPVKIRFAPTFVAQPQMVVHAAPVVIPVMAAKAPPMMKPVVIQPVVIPKAAPLIQPVVSQKVAPMIQPVGQQGAGWAPGPPAGPRGPGLFEMETVCRGYEAEGGLPGGDGSKIPEGCSLYISGLPADCDDIHLYRLFAPFGAIAPQGVRAMKQGGPTGPCKGFGFVDFLSPASAQNAIRTLNGALMPDNTTVLGVTLKLKKGGQFGG